MSANDTEVAPCAIAGRFPSGGSLRLSPALAGGRYFAGLAAIFRRIASAAGPCQLTSSAWLWLRVPSSAAVNWNVFAPGRSLARTVKLPSPRGLTAVRAPSGPSMYTVAPAGDTAPLSAGAESVVAKLTVGALDSPMNGSSSLS